MSDQSESPVVETDDVPEETRHEALTKAFDSLESEETPEEPEVEKPEAEEKPARDATGKFVTREKPPPEEGLEDKDKPEEKPKEERDYFKSWSKGLEEQVNALPEEVYTQIQKREEDIEKGFLRIEQITHEHAEFNKAVQPYMQTINALGIKPAQAVEKLLNADHILRTAPPEQKNSYFRKLARNYGIDVTNLPSEDNPQQTELQEKIYSLQNQIQSLQQGTQDAALVPYINEINQLASDPAFPHFDELRPVMASLIEAGRAQDLKSAYAIAEKTIQENPPLDLDQEKKKWQEEYEREQKAKAAAALVKGSGPTDKPSNVNTHDRRAIIEAAMDNLGR